MNNTFDVYLSKSKLNTNFLLTYMTNGASNLGSSIHAVLLISNEGLKLTSDDGGAIFDLRTNEVQSIADNLSAITIGSNDNTFTLNFNNVRKGGIKMLLLGPLLTNRSKDSPYSPEVQSKCKEALDVLAQCGYKVEYNGHRSN